VLILLFTVLSFALVSKGETVGSVEYSGGTVERLKSGADGKLRTGLPAMVFQFQRGSVEVPYDRINLLEYGQNASRRIVAAVLVSPMFLLSKSRKHFLTVGFTDENGQQQAMVFRLDKSHVRALLASLEARTGLRIQYQDDEARKAGRG
jgi:hypothetical protein